MHRSQLIRLLLLCLFATVLNSCVGRSALRFDKLYEATGKGDYLTAIKTIQQNPKLYGKTNKFLYYMDIGMLFHYAGQFDSSNTYLLKASDIYDDLFARSVTNEAAAMLTNDNVRPYRSKPYELVLMHQVIALNFMAKGNLEDALVESRKTQLLFNEWERKGYKDGKYSTDGMFHYLSSIIYDAQGKSDDAMISLYNAIKAFQMGPVALPAEIANYACYMFQKNNRSEDIARLQLKPEIPDSALKELNNNQTEIIMVGYAGKGPAFQEKVWWGTWVKDGLLVIHHDLPNGQQETMSMGAPGLPGKEYEKASKGQKTESGTTFHIKVAVPEVRTFPSETQYFSVKNISTGDSLNSTVINDLDKHASKQLDDIAAPTIARTVVRVVLRTIAAQRAKEEMKTDNTLANLLINIGTDVLADQLEKADVRSCFLIPKTVQIVRIPVEPGTHNLEIVARGVGGKYLSSKVFSNIDVKKNEKKLLFYGSFR